MNPVSETVRVLWTKAKELTDEARREFYKAMSHEDKQACQRLSLAEVFEKSTPLVDKRKEHFSPSGRYRLVVTPYGTGPKTWNVTQGLVYRVETGELISEVQYNYHDFPHAWVENHPKTGMDYLVCEENYQGQSVIELNTGKRIDYLPTAASQGVGFCWTSIYPNPDGTLLAVNGCYWAAPYEMRIVDFSDPMSLPWPELAQDTSNEKWEGWIDNDSCKLGREYEFSKKYQKPLFELPEEQRDEVDCTDDIEERTEVIIWTRPSNLEVARTYLKEALEWRKGTVFRFTPTF